MKTFVAHSNHLLSVVLSVTALVILGCGNALADDADLSLRNIKSSLVSIQYDKDFKIRGWEVSDKIYFGQAKVAGRYGLGVIIDKGSYSWGINNRGIAFVKRF